MESVRFPALVVCSGVVSLLVWLAGSPVPQIVLAQGGSPRTGNWTLNLAKSKYSPGPPPKSQTRRDEQSRDSFKTTVEGIAADGTRIAYGYTANYDGKDYPMTGSGTPNGADTIAIRRIDDYTTEATGKRMGKVVLTAKAAVSKDGKVLTITTQGTDTSGKATNTVTVYDKQ